MTSNSDSECFVYITLPGAVSAVTAGRFVLDKTRTGEPLGRFVYGLSYLANLAPCPSIRWNSSYPRRHTRRFS
jgi:hypothetical protein